MIENHKLSDDFNLIRKSELSLLINAERFITCLDFKSKWEIQTDLIEKKYDKLF